MYIRQRTFYVLLIAEFQRPDNKDIPNMKRLTQFLAAVTSVCLLSITAVNASLLTWDFTVVVDDVYLDNANAIDDSIVAGTLLNGSFSYDDGLVEDSPGRSYSDGYTDPSGTFTVAGLGIYEWEVGLSVVHQTTRDIVNVSGDYSLGAIRESFEIDFLDYTQSYDNGELPVDWHTPPTAFTKFNFDYTLFLGTDPCCFDSWLRGSVSSIVLRPTIDVSAPSTIAIFALGMMGLASGRIKRKP
jgi:hypothetical protein